MNGRATRGRLRAIERQIAALGAAALVLFSAAPAHTHAFGERYDLPLPLGLYLGAAAAAVVVSFIVIALFVRDGARSRDYPRLDLLAYPLGRLLAHPTVLFVLKLSSVLLLVLVIAAGYFGHQDPFRNIAPVLVWILFWVGMAVVSAFVGDLWAVINPWRTLFAWAEALWRRLRQGRELAFGLPYPQALGVWPAGALLLAFTWSELISSRPAVPAYVASMAVAYSTLTWIGMILFGRERWLRHGEVFSVTFAILARFAPIEVRSTPPELVLRPYAVGLLRDDHVSNSTVGFVLLYLVAVIYDGILVMPFWLELEAQTGAAISVAAEVSRIVVRTAGLIGAWAACVAVYLLTCRAMGALADGQRGAWEIAQRFVFTLVPIAIAYHLAHYLTYLLIQGQYAIPLASDPLGRGWDLFGTAAYRVNVGAVGARFAWYTAVIAIVVGHIVAVFLAHAQAGAVFGGRRMALRSQYPLMALMVAFTIMSLSVLAEPIVQSTPSLAASRAPATSVAVPADAVLPEPATGRLMPVGEGRTATLKLTYGAMASPFHDGSAMTAADLLYPFALAYRWGARGTATNAAVDPAIARATELLRQRLKGIKFAGVDQGSRTIRFGDLTYARERLLVDVYVDAAAGDVETAAAMAPPWSPVPWHVIALMEEAVSRGWAAFSQAEAARLGIEWLDPVRSEPLKRRLAAAVDEFERSGYVPAPLAGMVTPADARARWKALAAFHAKHDHWLVTNGPYQIKSWADGAAVLEVVRDPRYPLGVGSYDSYAIPRRAFVVQAETGAAGIALSVEIETIERTMRDYRLVRQPLKASVVAFGRRIIPECRYVIVGADGRAALSGKGRFREDGAIVLDLAGKLAAGRYTVFAGLYPNGNAVNVEIRRIPYEVQ